MLVEIGMQIRFSQNQ